MSPDEDSTQTTDCILTIKKVSAMSRNIKYPVAATDQDLESPRVTPTPELKQQHIREDEDLSFSYLEQIGNDQRMGRAPPTSHGRAFGIGLRLSKLRRIMQIRGT